MTHPDLPDTPVVGVPGSIVVHVRQVVVVNGVRGSYSLHQQPSGALEPCECRDGHGRPFLEVRWRAPWSPPAPEPPDAGMRTPCPRKHPLALRYRDVYGKLHCRQCDRDKRRERRERAA